MEKQLPYVEATEDCKGYNYPCNSCTTPNCRDRKSEPDVMSECEKHGATCDVCNARNCLSRKNNQM